jgi:glucokinase
MVYIGIDLGGTGIKAGVVDERGTLLKKASCPTGVERGHEAVIRDMAALALKALAEAGIPIGELAAVGIGLPGVLEPLTGIVPFCTNLGWHMVPVIQLMQTAIDVPVYVDNDATVAALAESVAGVTAGCANSVFLTLGTGVGGGVILNHKVYAGPHGVASELGHMIIALDGEQCTCGNRGCWERYSSATALIRMGKEAAFKDKDSLLNRVERLNAKAVEDAARAGDEAAMGVFERYVYYLAAGLVSIINFYDPEIIALGGGVAGAGDFLLLPLREKLREMVFYKTMPYARVELATLGNDAGVIGAAMLGRQ